ncbi:hypothetical protein ANN_25136 [Periplaneta americana]|uniref:C2H2-type domain-containing protein n=1 Tax=Periplaneta americana TaxID=6978 RepID=A0ABQ8S0L3_PERAM|nr:hypothetical protein ANN_25136 [Periplaneta americana]
MLTRELLTLSNPQAESTFECGRCGKNYRYKKSMLRHLRLECGKEPQFYCPYCPHRTKHKKLKEGRRRTIGLEQILILQQSGRHTDQHLDRQHVGIRHVRYMENVMSQLKSSEVDISTPFLPINMRNEEVMLTYRKKQEEFQCQTCGKSYRYKKNMIRHIRFECGKEPQFQCPYCPHQTKHKSSVQIHIRNRHPDAII